MNAASTGIRPAPTPRTRPRARSGTEEGPFAPVGVLIAATGSGSRYAELDRGSWLEPQPWYRVIEQTAAGRETVSRAFQAFDEAADRGLSRTRAPRVR